MARTGLSVPFTSLFGEAESLPILSCRDGEIVPVPIAPEAWNDDDNALVQLPDSTLAIELSFRNAGDTDATISYISCGPNAPANDAARVAAALKSLPRLVPAGAQLIEHRRAEQHDWLLVERTSEDVIVTIHAHVEAD